MFLLMHTNAYENTRNSHHTNKQHLHVHVNRNGRVFSLNCYYEPVSCGYTHQAAMTRTIHVVTAGDYGNYTLKPDIAHVYKYGFIVFIVIFTKQLCEHQHKPQENWIRVYRNQVLYIQSKIKWYKKKHGRSVYRFSCCTHKPVIIHASQ